MKIIVFWLLSLMFAANCLRLGTVLLETDKIISRSMKNPEETTGDAVVQNLRIYIKTLRLLRDKQEKGLNKRNTRLTEALVNHGRPYFLRYDIDSMANALIIDCEWKEEDVNTVVELFKEAERLRDMIQRCYRRQLTKI